MEGAVVPATVPVPVPEEAVRIAARLRASAGKRKMIVFTSGGGGEGASAVAGAVAAALAQTDLGPVLLVDANFTAPTCHRLFALDPRPGLSDVLLGGASFEQAVRASGVDRLSVMPVGAPVPAAAALRTLATLSSVAATARERYEYVLVDAPSFVKSAVASLIIAEGDGVVLVVGAGAHKRAELVEMRRELEGLQTRLLGVVLSGRGG